MSDLFCSNALPADYESAPILSMAAEGATAGTDNEWIERRQGELLEAAQRRHMDKAV